MDAGGGVGGGCRRSSWGGTREELWVENPATSARRTSRCGGECVGRAVGPWIRNPDPSPTMVLQKQR
eukprot:CCRYP_002390-RE/>CCRYP_002390-RE protein AED:0.49 eAED:1.00 QI:0/0/0/1/0/0/2/0/66